MYFIYIFFNQEQMVLSKQKELISDRKTPHKHNKKNRAAFGYSYLASE